MADLIHQDYNKIKYFMDEVTTDDTHFKNNVLKAFKEHFGFFKGIFWICDENNDFDLQPISMNINDKYIHQYRESFYEKDPIIPIHTFPEKNNKNKRVIVLDNIQSNKKFENSEYYNNFFKEINLYHNLGLFLTDKDKLIGFLDFPWPKNEVDINESDIMCLELIARSLSNTTTDYLSQKKTEKLHSKNSKLSTREIDVFDLLIQGHTNNDISSSLFISVNTVKKHIKSIFEKYNVTNRTMLSFKTIK